MVDNISEIVKQVIAASGDQDIRNIIHHYLGGFPEEENNYPGAKIDHINHILIALRSVAAEDLQGQEIENVRHAIEITEGILDWEYESFF